MSSSISPIPPVPQAIKDAVNTGSLAVFIGAGVSRIVGCCGWDELAKNLVDRCHKEDVINFKEKETLAKNQDHKKTITICYHLFHNNHLANIFFDEMSIALREGKFNDAPPIYKDIFKLRGLFLTTNSDTHFDWLFHEPNRLFMLNDFNENRIDKENLYHIHGSIRNKDSLVFTVSEYIRRYTNQVFRRFLEKIFREFTVLFLGYGVSEFEILDFILQGKPQTHREEPRHYILSPFYRGEENILKYEQTYYNELGINVLGYEKDLNGYMQLVNIISSWNEDINQITGYQYKAFRQIDEVVE